LSQATRAKRSRFDTREPFAITVQRILSQTDIFLLKVMLGILECKMETVITSEISIITLQTPVSFTFHIEQKSDLP